MDEQGLEYSIFLKKKKMEEEGGGSPYQMLKQYYAGIPETVDNGREDK